MELAQIRQLIQYTSFPCVSVIIRTHTTHPENQKDDTQLRNQFKEVERRLTAENVDKRIFGAIMHDLNFLAEEIDHQFNSEGLILFVSQNHRSWHRVGFPVDDRVIIDETFATRDLVRQVLDSKRYRILTLSDKAIRLFKGYDRQLIETRYKHFPADISGMLSHHRGEGNEKDKRKELLNRIDKDFQDVIRTEPLPLVLMGTEQNISAFKSVSDRTDRITAEITGNFDDTPHKLIAEQAVDALGDVKAYLHQQHLDELGEAVGANSYASGIQQVWRGAFKANGRKLFVENSYKQAGIVVGGIDGYELEFVDDHTAPGVIDDLVDEAIEEVLKYGGEVAFMPDGSLEKHNRIALILRS